MRRSALVCLLCVSLGCMRIYPDPELPDLDVFWYADDCSEATPEILFTFTSLEDGSTFERSAACDARELVIADVKRHRYRVDGNLLAADGSVFVTATDEADLRNSIDTEVYLYFEVNSRVRLDWTFDMGATCASLGADYVSVEFYTDNYYFTRGGQTCEALAYVGSPGPLGVLPLTVEVRAYAGLETVAISPRSAEFTLSSMVTDLGTFVLTPCGSSCPLPPDEL